MKESNETKRLMVQAQRDNPEVFRHLAELKAENNEAFSTQAVLDLGSHGDLTMRMSLSKRLCTD